MPISKIQVWISFIFCQYFSASNMLFTVRLCVYLVDFLQIAYNYGIYNFIYTNRFFSIKFPNFLYLHSELSLLFSYYLKISRTLAHLMLEPLSLPPDDQFMELGPIFAYPIRQQLACWWWRLFSTQRKPVHSDFTQKHCAHLHIISICVCVVLWCHVCARFLSFYHTRTQ